MIAHRSVSLCDRAQMIAKGALLPLFLSVLIVVVSAKANAEPNEDIIAAASAGDRARVEAALSAGASVNAVDPLGSSGQTTPLSIAAAKGHRNVAEVLLDHGANVNSADGLGQTALHTAADHGSTDVAKLLLERGAEIDARDFLGATPLQYAALRGHATTVALLITRGAIVNAQSSSGKTALHLAAAAGHQEVVALLLAHGADARIRNSDGQTPLQEMQASSSVDPATKFKIGAMLGTKPPPRQIPRSSAPSPTPPAPTSPTAVQEPQQNGLPACTDVTGLTRVVMEANPGAPPQVIAVAVQKLQVMMGCR